MKYNELSIGQRLYNRGDMANIDHWGTITRIEPPGRFSDQIHIQADDDRRAYCVPACAISDVDKGNGLTRIVTKEARETYIKKCM